MANGSRLMAFATMVASTTLLTSAMAQDAPLQGGVIQNQEAQGYPAPAYSAYPAPQMIPQNVKPAPVKQPPKQKPLKAKVQQQQQRPQSLNAGVQQQQQRPPMQASAQASPPPGVLPAQFMGNWLVLGQRQNIQARPEYQNGIENIFSGSNSQTWNIVGQPGGYSMSSTTGVQQVQVGQCDQTTAFLRYSHPVGNTTAQEAIVMKISADGRTFQGMQRITIKKQGEGSPRAQVTYQLMGRRQ